MKIIVLIILVSAFNLTELQGRQKAPGIEYRHPAPGSVKSGFVKAVLRIMGKNKLQKEISKKPEPRYPACIPKNYFSEIEVDTQTFAGREVYTLTPKNGGSGTRVLYLHGGAFIHNISKAHWNLIMELMRKTGAVFVVPDYHLAPFHTAVDAFNMLEQVYTHMLSQSNGGSIVLMGDSAGGGMGLSFAQKLKLEGAPLPQQLIMISPWLNVNNRNVDSVLLQKDPMLEPDASREVGRMWAGRLGTSHYLVSPINGDLTGLCPVTVFTGGHDILLSQSQKLKTLMQDKGIPLNYFEYPKMFHVWVAATFLKEAKVAIGQMSELIGNAGYAQGNVSAAEK